MAVRSHRSTEASAQEFSRKVNERVGASRCRISHNTTTGLGALSSESHPEFHTRTGADDLIGPA